MPDRQPIAERAPRPSPPEDDGALRWTAHPAARQPTLVAVVVLIAIAAGVLAISWVESLLFGLLATALVLGALLPFLLPTHYTLAGTRVAIRTAAYRFERDLTAFRAFERSPRTVWLCTLSRRSVLDNYRGMPLYLSGNAETVCDALRAAGLEERR